MQFYATPTNYLHVHVLIACNGRECATTTVSAPVCTESTTRKGSDVWRYFKKVNGEAKAKCDICQNLLAYRGGTTNLRDHLVAKHPLFYSPSSNNTKQHYQGIRHYKEDTEHSLFQI